MLAITFRVPHGQERGPWLLVIVLQKDNWERMKIADPPDLQVKNYPMLRNVPAAALDIVIAYEEDEVTLLNYKRRNDIVGLLRWLERGRTLLPGEPGPPVRIE